jgi:hypothetical protein
MESYESIMNGETSEQIKMLHGAVSDLDFKISTLIKQYDSNLLNSMIVIY